MASVQKSVLVPYRAQEMFELVERVEDYPRFLPWCAGATILERTEVETTARLDINYRGVRAHFTTANRIERPERIVIGLRSGPFRRLEGTWRFTVLGDIGSKVELTMAYEFATPALARLIGPVFGRIAHTFVDAFVHRAEALHGGAPARPPGPA
ncbi:MAG TPA: type II toxin-antitoxin system RatA family toxin [Casimicrobiaceae bacterium]|nr:type II toxin-antitoxin system RatA family toxin [Casimicrobiaceae bacterium]